MPRALGWAPSGVAAFPAAFIDPPCRRLFLRSRRFQLQHASSGWSTLGFKSYQQGRGSFEGTAQHGIWLDEEPPLDVYGECIIRTATTARVVLLTFTLLEGMSEVVIGFLPTEMRPGAEFE